MKLKSIFFSYWAIVPLMLHVLAAAEQIAFMDADIGQEAFRRRIAGADAELAGRLLFDLDVEHGAIGRAALDVGDLDLLEVAEIFQVLLGALDLRGAEGVAFRHLELASDDAVEGRDIAVDVDPLDIDTRAFGDIVSDIEGVLFLVARDQRPDVDEGIAAIADRRRQLVDRFLDLVGVVPIVVMGRQHRHQIGRLQILQADIQTDMAELVALALVHRERDDEPVARRCKFGHRGCDAEIGIALGQVVFPQQLAVIGQSIGIERVGSLENIRYQRDSLVEMTA